MQEIISKENMERLSKTVGWMYGLAGYPMPNIIICQNPFAMQLNANAMSKIDFKGKNLFKMVHNQKPKEQNLNEEIADGIEREFYKFFNFGHDLRENRFLWQIRYAVKLYFKDIEIGGSIQGKSTLSAFKTDKTEFYDWGYIGTYDDKNWIIRGNEYLDVFLDIPFWDSIYLENYALFCEMPVEISVERVVWKDKFRIELIKNA